MIESVCDDYTFIGFDCAYRTLGWAILGFNPCSVAEKLRRVSAATPNDSNGPNGSKEIIERLLFFNI